RDEERQRGYCMGLKDQFGILSDGTVIPCCMDNDGEIPLGNVFEEELTDILNSKRALNLRKGLMERKLVEDRCKICGFIKKFDK
ncbi:MAG: SPASM domain-containing protein, partial [Clostridia bacterium]|nr:SPASM domain-containing protein [Clostridia bacterium]